MYLGKLVEMADRDELYARPRHPYTVALLSAVPSPEPLSRTADGRRERRERIRLTGRRPEPAQPAARAAASTPAAGRRRTSARRRRHRWWRWRRGTWRPATSPRTAEASRRGRADGQPRSGQTSCTHPPSARRRASWPGVMTYTTPLADLARACASLSSSRGAVLVAHRAWCFRRAAQVFQQPLFDLVAAEIGWGRHVRLPRCTGGHPAAGHQSGTATAYSAIARLTEIDLTGPGAVSAAFTRARPRPPPGGAAG